MEYKIKIDLTLEDEKLTDSRSCLLNEGKVDDKRNNNKSK